MAYGTVTNHGTMFVGFASEQKPLADMLTSMVETPDALTRYTHAAHRRLLLRAVDRGALGRFRLTRRGTVHRS